MNDTGQCYKILIIDDDKAWGNHLANVLGQLNFDVQYEDQAENALMAIKKKGPDIVLLDILFHGDNKGKPTFKRIKAKFPDLPVIILSSTTVDISYQEEDYPGSAMAYDKSALNPKDRESYVTFAAKIRERVQDSDPVEMVIERLREVGLLVGQSKAMRNVCRLIHNAALAEADVLITGETGTGKDVVANAIHYFSERKGDFVPVNCSSISESIDNFEIFGICAKVANETAERPGFFEEAHKGTLFLDEIGSMRITQQAILLKVLQDRKVRRVGAQKTCKCQNKLHPDHTSIHVDVKVIAATNENLQNAINDGRFRLDLYRRVRDIHIHLPPLRERKEDIKLLAEYFINKHKKGLNRPEILPTLRPDVESVLLDYDWPMNIGELQSSIRQAIVSCPGTTLMPQHFNMGGQERNGAETQSLVEIIVQEVFDGKLTMNTIISKYKADIRTQIFNNLIEKWITDKGWRPESKELATLLKDKPGNMRTKLKECGIRLTDWDK